MSDSINEKFRHFLESPNEANRDSVAEEIEARFPGIAKNKIQELLALLKCVFGSKPTITLVDVEFMLKEQNLDMTHFELKMIRAKVGLRDAGVLTCSDVLKIYQEALFEKYGEHEAFKDVTTINVGHVGVKGAAKFFNAKSVDPTDLKAQEEAMKKKRALLEQEVKRFFEPKKKVFAKSPPVDVSAVGVKGAIKVIEDKAKQLAAGCSKDVKIQKKIVEVEQNEPIQCALGNDVVLGSIAYDGDPDGKENAQGAVKMIDDKSKQDVKSTEKSTQMKPHENSVETQSANDEHELESDPESDSEPEQGNVKRLTKFFNKEE